MMGFVEERSGEFRVCAWKREREIGDLGLASG